ncbi:hypothetical protein B4099_0017 [Heyndrickxia coagulans]|uniref:Uncharacterized protein n=1 Tax=Heyndrickxia coagulans TaxID=1398 RepID=A0A150K911_HEYCO|nr:hypothetical protein B4099_0017 [Heyndrickxia coagulans]
MVCLKTRQATVKRCSAANKMEDLQEHLLEGVEYDAQYY